MVSLVGIGRGNGFESNTFCGRGVCLCLRGANGWMDKGRGVVGLQKQCRWLRIKAEPYRFL